MKAPGPLHKLRALVRAAEDPRLHETDMKVLVVLVDSIGKTGTGWWGFGTIAKRIGKHRTAVIRSIALLESLGHIRCHRTGGGGPANTTRYEIVEAFTSSADATSSVHATSSTDAPDQSHPRTEPVAPTHHESVLEPEEQKQPVQETGETASSSNSNSDRSVVSAAEAWKTALAVLTGTGLQEAKARTLVGLARKILREDDAALREIVETLAREPKVDPGAWLLAAARRRAQQAARPARKPIAHASAAEAEATADAALARLEVARHA